MLPDLVPVSTIHNVERDFHRPSLKFPVCVRHVCTTRVHLRYAKIHKDHGAPASGTYCNPHAYGQATVKLLMSRADRNRKILCYSTVFPLHAFFRLFMKYVGQCATCASKEFLLVLEAPAEQVVTQSSIGGPGIVFSLLCSSKASQ